MRLRHARRHRAHAHFGHQLHGNSRLRIHVFQIENELRQVFDRINIVVRRRRNQAYAGNRVAHAGDHVVHLMAGQLAAFARLRALRDLDLQVVRVDQIIRRDAETRRGHLLDRAAAQIAVRVRNEAGLVLAALAGVRFPADAVHGDGQRFVRFLADRAEGHRAGGKALHDFGGRLDLIEGNGRAVRLEIKHAAQHLQIAILLIHDVREFPEALEFLLPHRVLQLADRRRVQQVAFAPHAVLIFPADAQFRVRQVRRLHREFMFHHRFASQHFDADALDARRCSGKIFLDERLIEAHRLKDLRALITLQRGNSHLRKRLQKPLVDGLHVAFENFVPGGFRRKCSGPVKILERFNRQIRIHRARAVAEQQREMHHFARLAGLHDQGHLVARSLANQMIVNGRKRQQAGDRRVFVVHAAVGQNQQRVTGLDRQRSAAAKSFNRFLELLIAALHAEQHGQAGRQEISPAHAAQLLQPPVGNHRMAQLQRVAIFRRLFQDVPFASDIGIEGHHQPFANRIDRRVGDLRESLLEITEKHLRLVG